MKFKGIHYYHDCIDAYDRFQIYIVETIAVEYFFPMVTVCTAYGKINTQRNFLDNHQY